MDPDKKNGHMTQYQIRYCGFWSDQLPIYLYSEPASIFCSFSMAVQKKSSALFLVFMAAIYSVLLCSFIMNKL